MGKDPTPHADRLRQQREERYGHLQATTDKPAGYIEGAKLRDTYPAKPARKKLIPYAGKDTKGIAPAERKGPQAEAKAKRAEARKRVKRKRKISID